MYAMRKYDDKLRPALMKKIALYPFFRSLRQLM
jgi:hypothetical protein